jgi:hypothetical protein
LVEPLRHQCSALMQERLVILDPQQRWVSWNALGLKCHRNDRRKVQTRGFVADLSVGLATDEAQI